MTLRKLLICITGCLLAATTLSVALLMGSASIPMAVPITLGTFSYHVAMRLLVGQAFSLLMHNDTDLDAPWYAQRSWEPRLYKLLRVRRWKGHMPTYDPELFDPSVHSWSQIAQAMCQAELVHETIVVLSFLPLVVCVVMGDLEDAPIFAVTSTLAALIDLSFVIMQRYNRPRVLRIAKRKASAK